MEKIKIIKYFSEVETTKEYKGYFCSIGEAITIVIMGTICGLKNVRQIHEWASSEKIKEFISKHFEITEIPCYWWLLCLLKLIKPASLSECFTRWTQSLIEEDKTERTLSFDGKTVRSTGKRKKNHDKTALQIVSAQIGELGVTLGQKTVEEGNSEVTAMRELVQLLDIEGCMIVADALHCKKKTAKIIAENDADYLLVVKDNNKGLKETIENHVQNEETHEQMDTFETIEKNADRIERRTAFVSDDIGWLEDAPLWEKLSCIGAVNRIVTTSKVTTNEWHYYISSRKLSAEELLKFARLEWSVETMHWLLDVHFCEDFCRVKDRNIQQNLNIFRKIALNSVKLFKAFSKSKKALSNIMLNCLVDSAHLLRVLSAF